MRASRVRQGFAREATGALTAAAFRVCGVDRVEIRVDPSNAVSLRIPRALGFTEEGTLRRRLPAKGRDAPRDAVVFALADELEASPVAAVALEAYDLLGRRICL